MKKLRKFQEEGVEFLLKNRTALLADEVGVGKTAQFLTAAARCEADSILIICPASIKWDYPSRCEEWGFSKRMVYVITPQNAWSFSQYTKGIFVMNYDICFRKEVAKVFSKRKYEVLIADESHYVKNQKSRRSKAFFGAGGYVSLAKRVWFVTGTPMLNRPEELFTTLNNLCPERIAPYNDYISFTIRYCGGHKGPWGWVADGATNRKELAQRLEGFMLRRERDVLPELPEKIMNVIHIEKTAAIEKGLYAEKKHEFSQEEGTIMSIRQKMGLAKVPEIVSYVNELMQTEDKLIIFAYHHAVIDELMFKFEKYFPIAITGKDDSKGKHTKISEFKAAEINKILICQIDAVGTGVDGLQDVCNHAVFSEISYVPGINQQAMGRLHRNGQKHKTIFDFLTVEGSIDENILEQNILKASDIQTIMQDQNHGMDFSKNKQKESIDMVEEQLERIADSLKILTKHLIGFDMVGKTVGADLTKGKDRAATGQDRLPPVPESITEEPKKETRGRPKKKEESVTEAIPTVFDDVKNGVQPSPQQPLPAAADPFGAVADPVAKVAELVVDYKQFIKKTAAIIQEKGGVKGTEIMGELNKVFKTQFPQYAHALVPMPQTDQDKVISIVNQFMEAKGFYGA